MHGGWGHYYEFQKRLNSLTLLAFSQQDRRWTKEILQIRFRGYFMKVTFSSPVNFSKSVFFGVKFCAKYEVVLQKQFLSVIGNHLKSDLTTENWVAESEEIPETWVFHRDSLKNSNDHRGKLDWNWLISCSKIAWWEKRRITHHYSAKLQTTPQILTASKHSIEFTYGNFPCHLKANRDKLALINRWWTQNVIHIFS